ncbi:MAG: MFS transporter [Candidatus Sericytochromatia bacterium]
MKNISKTVFIVSLISLFTDTASEMLYPIMPLYLKEIGFSIVLIGILEGLAEATASISKGYFGKLSDIYEKRAIFVQLGYSLSALSKPMLALFSYPIWIFFSRSIDRLGKGIRTGARDAILSDESTKETKGEVFGFHRSMDTLGAVIGPSLALIYLYFYPNDYKTLFFISFFPGLLAILASFLLKDKVSTKKITKKTQSHFLSFLEYWKTSQSNYKKVVIGLLIFSLFNSSDTFLLLKLKQDGLSDTSIISIYIFYNIIYALFSFPMGVIGDKIGLKKIYLFGLILFSFVYFGMSINTNIFYFFILFFLYGIYASSTEGISKAWITNIIDNNEVATAIGTFTALQGICTMISSSIAGIIWFNFGSSATFITTGIASLIVFIYFLTLKSSPDKNNI